MWNVALTRFRDVPGVTQLATFDTKALAVAHGVKLISEHEARADWNRPRFNPKAAELALNHRYGEYHAQDENHQWFTVAVSSGSLRPYSTTADAEPPEPIEPTDGGSLAYQRGQRDALAGVAPLGVPADYMRGYSDGCRTRAERR